MNFSPTYDELDFESRDVIDAQDTADALAILNDTEEGF